MKNLISNIKINKLKHPTFEFECESKYLAEFLNKLYSAKLSLAEIKRNNGLN